MHDKNGKEIKLNSFVKLKTYIHGEQRDVVAQVIKLKPESDSCNVYVGVPYPTLAIREEYTNAKDVEVVE
jgi:hypothetical protein